MNKMLIDLPAQLDTARLVLRPFRAGDGPAYFAVCERNRAHLLPYEEGNPALNVHAVDEAEILVREFAAMWASRSAFFLGGWQRESGGFAAQIYVGVASWDLPEFEIGYFVDVDHEGQGYVTEGVNAALRFAFETMGASRVRLGCNDTNTRSWHVAERCGLVREGHLRQTRPQITHPDGTPSGDYLYGMLRSEYEARAGIGSHRGMMQLNKMNG